MSACLSQGPRLPSQAGHLWLEAALYLPCSIPGDPSTSPGLGQQGWGGRTTSCPAIPAPGSTQGALALQKGLEWGEHTPCSRPSTGPHSHEPWAAAANDLRLAA